MTEGFDFDRVPYDCDRWMEEVPEGAFVAVLHSAASYKGPNDLTLSLNLMGVLILALAAED